LQAALYQQGQEGADGTAHWKAMFEMVDADGNGHLGPEEMGVFFKMMGRKQTELRAMYREVDGDGNGKVSFSEFCDWFKREVLKTQIQGAQNSLKQAENSWLGLSGKSKAMNEQIAADKKILAGIRKEERVAQARSDLCATRIRENRTLHQNLSALMNGVFHQTCQTRDILKNVRRSASHRGQGTHLFLATGHHKQSHGKHEDMMDIVTSASTGSINDRSIQFGKGRISPLSMVHSQSIKTGSSSNRSGAGSRSQLPGMRAPKRKTLSSI
jgi:hypothetical protein